MATTPNSNINIPYSQFLDATTGRPSLEWLMWLMNPSFISVNIGGGLPVTSGGTGITTIPTNGQLLIGNGTGYTLNTLGYGVGISVTNGSGTITVANTGVLSNIQGNGISVSNSTGDVTISNTGVLSWSGGTTGLTPSTATAGSVTLGGTLAIANGGTNGSATPTTYGVAYGDGSAYAFTAAGTTGQVLTATTGSAPTWAAPATGGTVTSVGLAMPAQFTVTNSPVTNSGTLTAAWNTQTANYVFSGPTTGAAAAPTFRALVSADIPSLAYVTSVGFTGGLISVATATTTPALTVAGTSGGLVYFSSASTWDSSAVLTANALMVGGGAGVAPSTITTGTGVVTALGVNTGSSGAFVVNGGALGTPSSGTVTNLTGTASININGTVGATTTNSGAFTSLSYSTTLTGGTGVITIGTNQFYKDASGNIGIGTTSPGEKVDVLGNIAVGVTSAANRVNFHRPADSLLGTYVGYHTASNSDFGLFNVSGGGNIRLIGNGGNLIFESTSGTERFRITPSGGASFGTTGTAYGSSGQVLSSNGNASPTWSSSLTALTSALVTGSGGLGYGTGSGGTTTQGTSRTTGVTLNKTNGAITMFSAAGSAVAATFTVTNSTVAATDTIILNQKSGTNLYVLLVTAVAAGSFNITFYTTGGVATDAPVINFSVIKAVTA